MKLTTRDIAQAAIASAYAMLTEQGMENEAGALAQDLRREIDQRGGIVSATLFTPTGDAGAFAQSIQAALEKKLGTPVVFAQKADPSLIGGAILQYGDTRIDLSLRGNLSHAQSQLEKTSS